MGPHRPTPTTVSKHRPFRPSLRTWLFALSLVAILPLMLFASYAMRAVQAEQRRHVQESLHHAADDIGGVIDQRIATAFSALKTLASHPDRRGEWSSVYRHAQQALAIDPMFYAVALTDGNGQALFHTAVAYGETTPDPSPELTRQVLATGRPLLSGPRMSPTYPTRLVVVAIALYRDDAVTNCLQLYLQADVLDQVLSQTEWPLHATASLVDRQGYIIARSHDGARYAGQRAAPALLAALPAPGHGLIEGKSREGIATTAVVLPIHGGDWFLGVGVPTETLQAPLQFQRLQWLALAAGWLALSLLLSQWLARYLSRQVQSLTQAVAEDWPITDRPIHVREFWSILESFVTARRQHDFVESDLTQMTLERNEARDLYEHAPCGYHSLNRDGCIVQINQTELDWLGYEAQEVMGRPFTDFMAETSQALFRINFPLFMQRGEIHDQEVELIRKNGTHLPAVISATALRNKDGEFVMSRSTVFDITERKRLEAQLEHLAKTDSLTDLSNRRDFYEQAEREISRHRRFQQPLSLLMIDIDHFKAINDRHGHAAGDEVLRQLAAQCRSTLRETDITARIGGEEFAVLMPQTGEDTAAEAAERLRHQLATHPALGPDGTAIAFTVSIGLTHFHERDADIADLLRRADTALYEAKETGRNRVCRCCPEDPPPVAVS